jgi:arylsulfatase A-like enzyme/Tfp pilus assembly protein PilF
MVNPRDSQGIRLSLVAVCAAALIVLAACRGRLPSPSSSTPVILISIDTLRSDHLPVYGYKGVATPNIDALRADSILYERAYSQVPLTLPSHISLLTGMLPADNGVRDNVGFRLADSIPTLPALLKKNGYATGGAVSAFVLRHETGMSRGFDFFDDEVEPVGPQPKDTPAVIGRVQRDGRETVRAEERWIDTVAGKPFFAFVHLYEPHTPYTPPEPYFSRYSNHYDGEIAYSDAIVGEFLDYLKQKDLYDDALIILLSDHGEGLNEHGEEEHGIFLYREALQVPLLMKLPKQSRGGATVDAPVELVDVFPTVLERTATPAAAGTRVDGESLLGFLRTKPDPQRPIYAETYYPRFHFGWSDLHSLISGNDHFIRAPRPELYDLGSDPAEKKNVIDQNRRAHARMREAIVPFVKGAAAPTNIGPEEAAKLAALGYLGSTVTTKEGEELPDPKSTVAVFHDIRVAFTFYRDGQENEALRLTKELLSNNPQITDLWDLECKIYNKLGDTRAAMNAAREGLRHSPTSVALLFDVANQAFALNDLDTARQHAEIAVKMEPGQAHELLSRIAAAKGDEKKARAEAAAALETSNDTTSSLLMLATYAKKDGDLAGALRYLNRAAERVARKSPPREQTLHLKRGDVLARLGRNEEAEREFRAEIADFPQAPDAYSSLIILLVGEHRTDEATKLVFDLIKAAPEPRSYVVVAETLKSIGDDRGAMFWAYQGIQKFPSNAELRELPERLQKATALLRKHLAE